MTGPAAGPKKENAVKVLTLIAFLALAASSQPMLSTNLVFDGDGVAVNPTLSGQVGGATVTVDP